MCSRSSSDCSEFALSCWKSLSSWKPSSEEEIAQRRVDLNNLITVFARKGDWGACRALLAEPESDRMHVIQVFRSLASASSPDVNQVVSLYLDHRDSLYTTQSAKDISFIINLLLDISKLRKDATLLELIAGDVIDHYSQLEISPKLFSRISRLCIDLNIPSCVYQLYMLSNEKQSHNSNIYRSIERYIMNLPNETRYENMKETIRRVHFCGVSEELHKERKEKKKRLPHKTRSMSS